MGLGTIMEAKELLLIASGESKSEAIKNALEGPSFSLDCPASLIQLHPNVTVIIDKSAASKLNQKFK